MGKGYKFSGETRQDTARKVANFRGVVSKTLNRNTAIVGHIQSDNKSGLYVVVVDVCGPESQEVNEVYKKMR